MESISLNTKFIGFLKKHNRLVKNSLFLEDLIKDDFVLNCREELINYLEKGKVFVSWMGYFIDDDSGELVTPDCYFTDGNYIWPSYLVYYLKKYPNYKLDSEFVSYLINSKFIFPSIDSDKLNSLEKVVSEILVSNPPKRR